MNAIFFILACVGQEPPDYALLLVPKDGVAYVDVDPEAGVLVRGRPEIYSTGTLGKAAAAFKEMFPTERLTLLGRTPDGRLWTSRQVRELWSWDGRSWSRAEVGFSADAEAAFRVMREKDIGHDIGPRLQYLGGTTFLVDRTGVFAYLGGGRWTYALAVEATRLAGRPGRVELRGWPGVDDAVCFQTGREGDGIVSWSSGAWQARSTLPAGFAPGEFDSLFRFPNGAWVGFGVVNRVRFHRPAPEETLKKLVADLDDESFDVRERATRELIPLAHELEAYLGGAADRGALTVEQRSRIEGIRSKRESAVRVLALEDGSVAETCEVIPILLQHPRTSKVLVVARFNREEDRGRFWFVELGPDGRGRILHPAEPRPSGSEPAWPVAVDAQGALYWQERGGLVRWTEQGLAVRRTPGRFAGFGPGGRAVFDAGRAAFEVSVDALRREFDRREEVVDDPQGSAGLDERRRLRILAASGTRGTGGLHERTEWKYRVHERGEWREVPDSPTFATYHCTMRHCRECHEANRQEAPPQRGAIRTSSLAFTGRLRDLATGTDVSPPDAETGGGYLLRGADGSIWAATVAGLFQLREDGGELRILQHQVREGGCCPLIRDGEGNVWQQVGRRLVRVAGGP